MDLEYSKYIDVDDSYLSQLIDEDGVPLRIRYQSDDWKHNFRLATLQLKRELKNSEELIKNVIESRFSMEGNSAIGFYPRVAFIRDILALYCMGQDTIPASVSVAYRSSRGLLDAALLFAINHPSSSPSHLIKFSTKRNMFTNIASCPATKESISILIETILTSYNNSKKNDTIYLESQLNDLLHLRVIQPLAAILYVTDTKHDATSPALKQYGQWVRRNSTKKHKLVSQHISGILDQINHETPKRLLLSENTILAYRKKFMKTDYFLKAKKTTDSIIDTLIYN
ncbi:hypothetical protein [Pseudoteredinibacter isoporae]|uniref:hypothetical protein n=1 Tax=Pseudoteredinibacter isoporae TaxID=570281 RepID=UPI0031036B7B